MCLNLPNGRYEWPGRKWSPYFIMCKDGRTIPTECTGASMIYDFMHKDCNIIYEVLNFAYNLSLHLHIPTFLTRILGTSESVHTKHETASMEDHERSQFSQYIIPQTAFKQPTVSIIYRSDNIPSNYFSEFTSNSDIYTPVSTRKSGNFGSTLEPSFSSKFNYQQVSHMIHPSSAVITYHLLDTNARLEQLSHQHIEVTFDGNANKHGHSKELWTAQVPSTQTCNQRHTNEMVDGSNLRDSVQSSVFPLSTGTTYSYSESFSKASSVSVKQTSKFSGTIYSGTVRNKMTDNRRYSNKTENDVSASTGSSILRHCLHIKPPSAASAINTDVTSLYDFHLYSSFVSGDKSSLLLSSLPFSEYEKSLSAEIMPSNKDEPIKTAHTVSYTFGYFTPPVKHNENMHATDYLSSWFTSVGLNITTKSFASPDISLITPTEVSVDLLTKSSCVGSADVTSLYEPHLYSSFLFGDKNSFLLSSPLFIEHQSLRVESMPSNKDEPTKDTRTVLSTFGHFIPSIKHNENKQATDYFSSWLTSIELDFITNSVVSTDINLIIQTEVLVDGSSHSSAEAQSNMPIISVDTLSGYNNIRPSHVVIKSNSVTTLQPKLYTSFGTGTLVSSYKVFQNGTMPTTLPSIQMQKLSKPFSSVETLAVPKLLFSSQTAVKPVYSVQTATMSNSVNMFKMKTVQRPFFSFETGTIFKPLSSFQKGALPKSFSSFQRRTDALRTIFGTHLGSGLSKTNTDTSMDVESRSLFITFDTLGGFRTSTSTHSNKPSHVNKTSIATHIKETNKILGSAKENRSTLTLTEQTSSHHFQNREVSSTLFYSDISKFSNQYGVSSYPNLSEVIGQSGNTEGTVTPSNKLPISPADKLGSTADYSSASTTSSVGLTSLPSFEPALDKTHFIIAVSVGVGGIVLLSILTALILCVCRSKYRRGTTRLKDLDSRVHGANEAR